MSLNAPHKRNAYMRAWNKAHPSYRAAARALYNKQRARNERLRLIKEFGGTCSSCGETDPIVLTFDHVQDDGADHRRTVRGKNTNDLVKSTPEKFQLLCQNCNWRKEYWRRRYAE